jgi:chromosome segregation ATPase
MENTVETQVLTGESRAEERKIENTVPLAKEGEREKEECEFDKHVLENMCNSARECIEGEYLPLEFGQAFCEEKKKLLEQQKDQMDSHIKIMQCALSGAESNTELHKSFEEQMKNSKNDREKLSKSLDRVIEIQKMAKTEKRWMSQRHYQKTNEKLVSLEESFESLNSQLITSRVDNGKIDQRLIALEDSVRSWSSRIDELNGKMKEFRSEKTKKICSLEESIRSLQVQVDHFDSRVQASLKKEIANLNIYTLEDYKSFVIELFNPKYLSPKIISAKQKRGPSDDDVNLFSAKIATDDVNLFSNNEESSRKSFSTVNLDGEQVVPSKKAQEPVHTILMRAKDEQKVLKFNPKDLKD